MKKIFLSLTLISTLSISSFANCNVAQNNQNNIPKTINNNIPMYDYDFSGLSVPASNIKTVRLNFPKQKINDNIIIELHTLKESSFNKNVLTEIFNKFYNNVDFKFIEDSKNLKEGRLYPYAVVKAKIFPENFDKIIFQTKEGLVIPNFALRKYFKVKDSFFQNEAYSYKDSNLKKPLKFSLYVMSHCPYAVRAEANLIDKIKNNKLNPEDINIHFILNNTKYGLTSLHGEQEIDEDARQLYIKNKLGMNKLFDYLKVLYDSKGNFNKALSSINLTNEEVFKDMNYIYKLLNIEAIYTEKNNINSSPSYVDREGKKIEMPK